MASKPAPLDYATAILPGLLVPPESQTAFLIGYGIVLFCNFTTTYHDNPLLRYLRLLLALPAFYALWDYGLSGKYGPYAKRNVGLGMAHIGIYGTLKVLEVCVFGFWTRDEDWPKWVALGEKGSGEEKENPNAGEVIPFKPTVWGRLCYAFDLSSACGSSWFTGRAWDWAPAAIRNQDPKPIPRISFFLSSLFRLFEVYLTADVIETIIATRQWDDGNPRPVTSLPYLQQLLYAFCVCAHTAVSIIAPYAILSTMTALLAVPSTAWPPIFDSPFTSRSLAEFWSLKWHAIFRRPFSKISEGLMRFMPTTYFNISPRGSKIVRSVVIFFLSYFVHITLVWVVPQADGQPHPPYFDIQAARFFLAQPLGLFVEFLFVFPLTGGLPRGWKTAARRTFAWGWLLWSGRYWSDVWFHRGQLGHAERYVIFSPVRGLLRGEWFIL